MPLAIENEELLELLSDALLRVDVGSIIIVTEMDDEPTSIDDGFAFIIPPWGEA
jgi:hypothetical protein